MPVHLPLYALIYILRRGRGAILMEEMKSMGKLDRAENASGERGKLGYAIG